MKQSMVFYIFKIRRYGAMEAQRRPKIVPGRPHDGPKRAQRGPKRTQERPKRAAGRLKMAQERLRTAAEARLRAPGLLGQPPPGSRMATFSPR